MTNEQAPQPTLKARKYKRQTLNIKDKSGKASLHSEKRGEELCLGARD
jgi:hypothetical protein